MQENLDKLRTIVAEIYNLEKAGAVLSWDQQTYMPAGGAEDRGEVLATLASLSHLRLTNDETGRLLSSVEDETAGLDANSVTAREIKAIKREYTKSVRIPTEKVAEFARVTTAAQNAWVKARAASDFKMFQDDLEKVVALRREYASYFAPYDHVYDPLLDDFEPGLKTADVQAIFTALRPQQVALIKNIAAQPQVDDSFLQLEYPEKGQWDFGIEVITAFGYDWQRGRLDKAAHPFTISFGQGDVRLTTRVNPNRFASFLFGTMHECGHGLYEQHLNPEFRRTALDGPASLAIHESQSRLWENLIGRSLPFWKHFYPILQARFTSQLANVSLDSFYKGINKVQPTFIRVEADEATYNLHIMLRLELEIALMDGSLAVKDLPDAWNSRMRDYLGITPNNVAQGVLQDVHWSGGMIGYFPTYALGNLVSAQLWEKIDEDIPDLESQVSNGKFAELLNWLQEKIHRYGRKLEPQELVMQVTGSKIDPNPYLRYLNRKYGEIYHL